MVSNTAGYRCCILHFKMLHVVSIEDMSGLQTSLPGTLNISFLSHTFVKCAEQGFALSCNKKKKSIDVPVQKKEEEVVL